MQSQTGRTVRIGGASGAWGDSAVAVPQLVEKGRVDYLVFDYLAELTMAILASIRQRQPEMGYAGDFPHMLAPSLPDIAASGIRVVSNAGGLNPHGCAAALAAAAAEQGLAPRIAVVDGDDVMPLVDTLRAEGVAEMTTGRPLPERLVTANAYLGALPIARALDAGADIVVTGRVVDSAVTLGVLMHEFGWAPDDHDRLAAGSLAGHIIECGCQATGGLFTDWEDVPGWETIGYPIVEVADDGGFIVSKPPETGGLVTPAVVAEQMLYEIGDPARYILPDVVADFTDVTLSQVGDNEVAVAGACGLPPTESYKVCATWRNGYKVAAAMTVIGFDAAAKARRMAEAMIDRSRDMLRAWDLGDFSRTNIETIGAESAYGPHGRAGAAREVVLRIALTHPDRKALEIFAREIGAAGLSWAPGVTGLSGRPKVAPQFELFSFLLDKSRLSPAVSLGGRRETVAVPAGMPLARPTPARTVPDDAVSGSDLVDIPLIAIAHGRSGDKGDSANIAIVARRPDIYPHLRRILTEERVAGFLDYLVDGPVTRFEVPGICALNFLCERALDGGVAGSLRNDPWGKGLAQILLSMTVSVPADLVG